MQELIEVAIVGCGWAGARHAQAYVQHGAHVRWLVDQDIERARALQQQHAGTHATTDYQHVLADPALDAVDICLPHNLHAPFAIAAAAAGKHILCEKPIAGTLEEADRMIKSAEQGDVCLMIAENVWFDPLLRKVRELIRGGLIGRPALIQMTREAYLTRSLLEERPWFLNRQAAAGGIMMSGGVHDFDKMRMLVGEIESVYALQAHQRMLEMEGDDTSVALVRFRDGAVGTLVESFVMKDFATAAGPETQTLRIDGDLGSLSVQDGRTIRLFSEHPDLLFGGDLTQHEIHVPAADTFALEIAHFLNALRTGEEPITSGRSQRRTLELVLAAYRSMETGQPVQLDNQ